MERENTSARKVWVKEPLCIMASAKHWWQSLTQADFSRERASRERATRAPASLQFRAKQISPSA